MQVINELKVLATQLEESQAWASKLSNNVKDLTDKSNADKAVLKSVTYSKDAEITRLK